MSNNDQRSHPFIGIFSHTPTLNLLSLNALSEAVGKQLTPQYEDSQLSSRITVSEAMHIPSVTDLKAPEGDSPSFRPANKTIESSQMPSREDSMRFMYREEHSQFSKEGLLEFLKIEESSIEVKEELSFEDPRLIELAVKNITHLKDERKKIDEQKTRIQRQKSQLDQKRTEIQKLLKEYYQLRQNSRQKKVQMSDNPHSYRAYSTVTKKNNGSTKNLNKNFRDDWSTKNHKPTIEKIKTEDRQISERESIKRKAKHQIARQALIIETLSINIIKNHNQAKILKYNFAQDFFRRLKGNSKLFKMTQFFKSLLDTTNIINKNVAFSKIKELNRIPKVQKQKTDKNQSKIIVKKNVVLRSTKKHSKAQYKLDRICQTEASRVEKLPELNFSELHSTSQGTNSIDFDQLTLERESSSNCETKTADTNRGRFSSVNKNTIRTSQIDTIIKNQITRAKQQKVLRQLSNQLDTSHMSFLKSSLCSGNVTSRPGNFKQLSGYTTQRRSESKISLNIFAAVTVANNPTTPSSSSKPRQSFNNPKPNTKKISIWRK